MSYHPQLDGPAEPVGLSMDKDTDQPALFIPLKTKFYDQFASGEKTTEYRRRVILSKGYGKQNRLTGRGVHQNQARRVKPNKSAAK